MDGRVPQPLLLWKFNYDLRNLNIIMLNNVNYHFSNSFIVFFDDDNRHNHNGTLLRILLLGGWPSIILQIQQAGKYFFVCKNWRATLSPR